MSFIIYALPRSRTYWLSRFLTYGDYHCQHEEMRYARSLDDVKSFFSQLFVGTCETAAAPYWRLVETYHPTTIVIRRNVHDVVRSLRAKLTFDIDVMTKIMAHLDAKLDQIEARVPNVMSVKYEDLQKEKTCKMIFEKCLPYQHDKKWWKSLNKTNLQVDLPAMMGYLNAYAPQLQKVAKIAKHQIIAQMSATRPEFDRDDGIVIRQETFAEAFADGRKLVEDHCVIVGITPEPEMHGNVELLKEMDKLGYVMVTTARCNGRMFGYLMAIMTPSIEHAGMMTAIHSSFYATDDFKGLGMKLQRASIEALWEREDVGQIYLHAGVRGDGPRMGTVYRRLGAVPDGERFKLVRR